MVDAKLRPGTLPERVLSLLLRFLLASATLLLVRLAPWEVSILMLSLHLFRDPLRRSGKALVDELAEPLSRSPPRSFGFTIARSACHGRILRKQKENRRQ
jgi:hypothetical protein